MTTCLGKSCSFGLPRVPFLNYCQFMYLVISFLVLRAGYGIWLYQFLIIAYRFTLNPVAMAWKYRKTKESFNTQFVYLYLNIMVLSRSVSMRGHDFLVTPEMTLTLFIFIKVSLLTLLKFLREFSLSICAKFRRETSRNLACENFCSRSEHEKRVCVCVFFFFFFFFWLICRYWSPNSYSACVLWTA